MNLSVISLAVLVAVVAIGFIKKVNLGFLSLGVAYFLAFEMRINPMATALYAKLGANAGCASVLSITGILAKNLSEPMGYSGFGLHLFMTTLLSGFLFTLVVYVIYKGYKVKADNPLKLSDIPEFNRDQRCTIAAVIVMVVCCIGFKLDTRLFAFGAASVLILLGCVDEKAAIKGIPWGTLVFICGVGALINVIKTLGGIDMISDFLTGFMSARTAAPILAATSGILSWVSSTTGVVMPALFPIADSVCQTFGEGVHYVELISAITATSFAAAISPLSTGGAIIMSSYSAARETSTVEMNNMFKTLFLLSVANVCMNVILAAVGVFGMGGVFY